MEKNKRKKCRHCKQLFNPDRRNANRQRFCARLACRSASKKYSRKKWLQKPENKDYFRSPENVKRVQEWRKVHPGYWRRNRKKQKSALQDILTPQPTEIKAKINQNTEDISEPHKNALQDSLIAKDPVIIGLIAAFMGTALQDDMDAIIFRLQQSGCEILNRFYSTNKQGGQNGTKASYFSKPHSPGTQKIQLGGSSSGS